MSLRRPIYIDNAEIYSNISAADKSRNFQSKHNWSNLCITCQYFGLCIGECPSNSPFLNPLDAKPFSLISAKGFLVKFVYREIMTLSGVKRHSTWPNVKLHTRFLTLWGVNCNVKLHTRVLTLWVINLQCKIAQSFFRP